MNLAVGVEYPPPAPRHASRRMEVRVHSGCVPYPLVGKTAVGAFPLSDYVHFGW